MMMRPWRNSHRIALVAAVVDCIAIRPVGSGCWRLEVERADILLVFKIVLKVDAVAHLEIRDGIEKMRRQDVGRLHHDIL